MHLAECPLAIEDWTKGIAMAVRIAMMEMTTNISMRVNACFFMGFAGGLMGNAHRWLVKSALNRNWTWGAGDL